MHWLPQLPQLAESVCVLTQLPLLKVCPAGHAPFTQDCPAAQTLPQLPQFCRLFDVSVHVLLHSDCPAGQLHMLLLQIWPPTQALPQLPQL